MCAGDCLSLKLTWDTLRNQRELNGNDVTRSGRSPVLGRGVGQGREYTNDGSGALESQKQVLVEGVLVSIGLKKITFSPTSMYLQNKLIQLPRTHSTKWKMTTYYRVFLVAVPCGVGAKPTWPLSRRMSPRTGFLEPLVTRAGIKDLGWGTLEVNATSLTCLWGLHRLIWSQIESDAEPVHKGQLHQHGGKQELKWRQISTECQV